MNRRRFIGVLAAPLIPSSDPTASPQDLVLSVDNLRIAIEQFEAMVRDAPVLLNGEILFLGGAA